MANKTSLRYNIGDRLHCNCYTDHNFSIKVEISAISNFELAESRYESIMLKMFNSDNAAELYEKFKNSTQHYYICEVLSITDEYNEGDYIILNDDLIQEEGTYYLNREIGLYLNVSYSTVTNYRNNEELMNDIKYYLETKGVDSVDIYEEMGYEEKLNKELEEYRSIITALKGLKSMEQLIDRMDYLFNTMVSKMSAIINKLSGK